LHLDAKLVPAKEKAELEEVLKTSKGSRHRLHHCARSWSLLWQRFYRNQGTVACHKLEDWCRRGRKKRHCAATRVSR